MQALVERVKQRGRARLTFESWDALARVLTGKRMELLRYVRHHTVSSVRALAKALGRDYSNVHADVQALTAAVWVCSQCGEPLFEAHEVQVIQDALKALDRESGRLLATSGR